MKLGLLVFCHCCSEEHEGVRFVQSCCKFHNLLWPLRIWKRYSFKVVASCGHFLERIVLLELTKNYSKLFNSSLEKDKKRDFK